MRAPVDPAKIPENGSPKGGDRQPTVHRRLRLPRETRTHAL